MVVRIPITISSVAGTVVKTVSVIKDIPTYKGCLIGPIDWNRRRKVNLAATSALDIKVKLGGIALVSFGT